MKSLNSSTKMYVILEVVNFKNIPFDLKISLSILVALSSSSNSL